MPERLFSRFHNCIEWVSIFPCMSESIPDRSKASIHEVPKFRFPEPIFPSDFHTINENRLSDELHIELVQELI